jgi:hypothetical protein
MITPSRGSRIWLARHRVDFRRQHNGLLAESFAMGLDPFRGDVVIFVGRNRRSLKVLYADRSGLWLSAKKFTLEAMKTKFTFVADPSCRSITEAELAMLAEGAAYTMGKKVRDYRIPVANTLKTSENPPNHGSARNSDGGFQTGVR